MIEDIKVKKTDDPEDRDGDYCFTDGCGNVSTELLKAMNDVIGVYRCSAFQVRLGGAKGVLMHKPELPGRLVELRPSQVKFVANEYFLEVVRGATFTQGYLNRQIILLLSCLGVPDEVFIHHLTSAMESLDMRVVLSNLEKIYKKSKKHKGDRKNLAQEMELFFGPSKVFGPIFKHALVRSFDLKHEQVKQ
jgi:RNA-dependent RNA polymerase